MTKCSTSYFRLRIEEYFDDLDLEVVCRKKRNAYAIYWAEDQEPLAKLRPTGQGDEVEVYYWDDVHWKQVTDFGLALPLEESLAYITDDPQNLFFDSDESEDMRFLSDDPEFVASIRALYRHVLQCVVAGGAVGGAFLGAGAGGAWGAVVGMILWMGLPTIRGDFRAISPHGILSGFPVSLVAGAGGVLGGALHGVVAHGVGGLLCGVLVGGLSSLLFFGSGWLARGIGFLAGLTLAARFVEYAQLRDHFAGLLLVAVAAAISGSLFASWAQNFVNAVRPVLSSHDQRESDDT